MYHPKAPSSNRAREPGHSYTHHREGLFSIRLSFFIYEKFENSKLIANKLKVKFIDCLKSSCF